MRASRGRRRPAVQYQEPDSADSSPLSSSRSPSSAVSLSWSDAETTFDRLLKGHVFHNVKTQPDPVNDSSSFDSEQAPSIRLFESPSAAPPVPPGKAARRRGKENRVSKTYGRPAKRAGPPSLSVDRSSLSVPRPSLSADRAGLSAGRHSGSVPGAAGRPLSGPSTSTPVPGRPWSAAPPLSPVPPGAAGGVNSPGASPQLASAAAGCLAHHGDPAAGVGERTPRRGPVTDGSPVLLPGSGAACSSPPPAQEAEMEHTSLPSAQEEAEMEHTSLPPQLSPATDATPLAQRSASLARTPPPPRLSFALDRTPVRPGDSPAGELTPSELGQSRAADASDLSTPEGLPVDMLPRFRSELFSSDEEEPPDTEQAEEEPPDTEQAEPPRRSRDRPTPLSAARSGNSGDTASLSGSFTSPAEARSDISLFADSQYGAEIDDVLEASEKCGSNASPQRGEQLEPSTDGEASGSQAAGHSGVSSLPSCFVRLGRLSGEELGRIDVNGCESGDAAFVAEGQDEHQEGTPPRSRHASASVGSMADCFVRLCRLEEPADGDVTAGEMEVDAAEGGGSDEAHACEDEHHGREDEHHGREDEHHKCEDEHHGREDEHHGREDEEDMSSQSPTQPASPEAGEAGRSAADAALGLGGVLLALRTGKGWRRSLCQVAPESAAEGRAGPGRLSIQPLRQLAEEDGRGMRAGAGRLSIQPLRKLAEEEDGRGMRAGAGRLSMQPLRQLAEEEDGRGMLAGAGRLSIQPLRQLAEEEDGRGMRAGAGRLFIQPLRQLAEEEDGRGMRTGPGRRRSIQPLHSVVEEEGSDDSSRLRSLRSGRGSIQPVLGLSEKERHSGKLRSLRSGRRSMQPFREVPEEEEEGAEDAIIGRELRSGRRSIQPVREESEEGYSKDAGRFRSLRSGRTTSVQPFEEVPGEEESEKSPKDVGRFRPLRSGRRSMLPLHDQQDQDQTDSQGLAGVRSQNNRRRSMQFHRELSEEEYSKALAALRSLREDLRVLQPCRDLSEEEEVDSKDSDGLHLRSGPVPLHPVQRPTEQDDEDELEHPNASRVTILPPSGHPEEDVEQSAAVDTKPTSPKPGRGSVQVSGVPPVDCVPTPRRLSSLPVGFSPAPKFRRSSVYMSSDAAAADGPAEPGADVSLSYEDPAGRVLELCGLRQPANFVQYCRRAKVTKKIGEGVYGEVFLCQTSSDTSVIKIMPIEGDFEVNDAAQKSYGEVLSELVISKSLSDLHAGSENTAEGFVRLLSSHVVRGAYPARLSKLWDQFDRDKGSENEHPRLFPGSQLFLVLEYSHAGADLENFEFSDVDQAIASFHQIAFSLAVAETALEFEHRDLHWGNVLLRAEPAPSLPGLLRGRRYRLPTVGLRATLIDFTLSRLRVDGAVVYNNLAEDPTLFNAHGDHQFEVYRQMRAATGDLWRQHCPVTNIQWLYYLADKMCSGCAYAAGRSRQHRQQLRRLHQLRQQVNDFSSAAELVETLLSEWRDS